MKRSLKPAVFFLYVLSCFAIYAQPAVQRVEVVVTPIRTDWTYKLGDRADFEVKVMMNGQLVPGAKVEYQIGPEQMPVVKTGKETLAEGAGKIQGIKMEKPGFLRCQASTVMDGRTYTAWGTAGFEPEKLTPVTRMPADFDSFWDKAKAELASIPMDAKMTLQPELCSGTVDVYHVELQNIRMNGSWQGNSRFYGTLSVPKKPGKYPAILAVPGAGVRPYHYRDDRAEKGVIVFTVGIHGIPVNMDPEVYSALATGPLAGYWLFNLDDLNSYYYKRVFMGCVRSVDFIHSLPQFDGENLAVSGGSQGGALAIITAGLDKRVKYLASVYPAMSDMLGYSDGRAGGWPHMFKDHQVAEKPRWTQVAPYYDVVNFARKLTVPGWYSWGYNDNVCPPTSMYAAYNVITAEKELHVFYETAHWTFPEQNEMQTNWLLKNLLNR
jgi:cephalosporin-C deacetylase-like acetyl esterase